MYWNRWYAFKSYTLGALWLAPLVAFVLSQITFRTTNALQIDFGFIPSFEFSQEGMVSAMDIDITLNLSYIVFTFGSLLVAIQVASGQLTPRIIATTLLRDNVIRCTVGVFFYALLIAVGARNRLETIPHFIVSLAAILGLVSTVGFLFLIDYAARLLRPVNIVWHLGERGIKVVDDVYPAAFGEPGEAARPRRELGPPARVVAHRGKSAIVIAVNLKSLLAAARRADGVVELAPRIGDFVAVGEPLFRLYGDAGTIDDRLLRGQVAFGAERTIEQDPTFAFRVIVDIAIKALSKAINDPTTAVLAIDQLHRLLRTVGKRQLHGEEVFDRAGRLRMVIRTPDWEDFVHLACREIRLYGAENFQIARRMRMMIESLIQELPEQRHPALRQELDLLDRAIAGLYPFLEDLALARIPDSQGLGGASGAKA